MAKKETTPKQPKQPKLKAATKKGKKLDISAVAIIDNLVFSKDEVWAMYQVSNVVYDFLSMQQKTAQAFRISTAFNALMGDREEPLECYYLGSSVPVNVEKWYTQVKNISNEWDEAGEGFDRYLTEQAAHLENSAYVRKIAIFGICLGKRGALDFDGLNVLNNGVEAAKDTMKQWLDNVLQAPGEYISVAEEKQFRAKEREYFETLSIGELQARRCTSEEILLVMKRILYPTMPTPDLDIDHDSRIGLGDIQLETTHAIRKKYRWLEITQMFGDQELTGYRAVMSFAKFPKNQRYPETMPFFYQLSEMGAPFSFYSRFTLRPSQKMKADLEKKRQEQKDEHDNYGAGDTTRTPPAEMLEAVQDLETMSEIIAQDKSPWVEGSYRVVVEAPNEEELRRYCAYLQMEYENDGIFIKWTAGDQVEMLLEQMPGDHKRSSTFDQVTNIHHISTSGTNFASEVGDPIFGE